MAKHIGKTADLERPTISVLTRIDNLRMEAYGLKREGLDTLLKAASTEVKAAKLMRQIKDPFVNEPLKNAAELNEKGENFVNATLLYIELNDLKSVKRIALNASKQFGAESIFGKALVAFSNTKSGTKEEREAVAELKEYAARYKKTVSHPIKFLRVDTSGKPIDAKAVFGANQYKE
jgi:hypothetical protein